MFYIFSIDNHTHAATMAKFLRFSDYQTMQGGGKVIPCQGMWQGRLEPSFITCSKTFLSLFAGGWVDEQEAFLRVEGSKYSPTFLINNTPLMVPTFAGYMCQVAKEEAFLAEGFTYRYDTNQYFILKDHPYGNTRPKVDQATYARSPYDFSEQVIFG